MVFFFFLTLSPNFSYLSGSLLKPRASQDFVTCLFSLLEGSFLPSAQPGLSLGLPQTGQVEAFEFYQCECYVSLLFLGACNLKKGSSDELITSLISNWGKAMTQVYLLPPPPAAPKLVVTGCHSTAFTQS